MDRLTELFERPSAWAGLAGLVLFLAALAWAGYEKLVPPGAAVCPALPTAGPSDHLRILDIGAAELELRGRLCLIVDNVVPDAALKAAQAAVSAARVEAAGLAQPQPRPQPQAPRPLVAKTVFSARLGRYITIRVPSTTPAAAPAAAAQDAGAPLARRAAADRLAAAQAALAQLTADRKLALFLNGERAPVEARPVEGQSRPQAVTFALRVEASAAGDAAAWWRGLLGGRSERGLVPVSVGVAEEGAARPAGTALRATPARNGGISVPLAVRVYHPPIVWLAAIGTMLMLFGLGGYARTTALLRDGRSPHSQYSLARVQMAWWFALATAGFVYIWLVTGQYLDVVGTGTFALIGIAGATAGAARAVEGPRGAPEPPTRGFLADITGGERVEMHRLQMIAWTLVLGAIYAWNVLVDFRLTDFDGSLLALAGVVSGVYVGLKTQEA